MGQFSQVGLDQRSVLEIEYISDLNKELKM